MPDDVPASGADAVRAFFAAYDRHDVDRMVALCAPDATYHYVPYGQQGIGRVHDTAAALWGSFVDAFPDFGVRVERVLPTTDGAVVVETVQGGTQAADVAGIENKHRATHVRHCFVVDVDAAGRLTSITAYWDNDSIYAQLGHTEPHS